MDDPFLSAQHGCEDLAHLVAVAFGRYQKRSCATSRYLHKKCAVAVAEGGSAFSVHGERSATVRERARSLTKGGGRIYKAVVQPGTH